MAFAKMQLPRPHFVGATALAVLLACGSVSLGVTWWAGRRLVSSPRLPPTPNTQPPVPCGMPLSTVTPAGQPCRMRFLGEGRPPPPASQTARSLHCPVLVILTEFVFWWVPREGVCQPDERLSGCAEGPTQWLPPDRHQLRPVG